MRRADLDHVLMPNTYVRLLTQEFADHAAIVAGTGIPPAELATYPHPLTIRQHLRCIANILPLRPSPDWHLQWGKRMAENFHGAVTMACLTAPTLGAGLDAFLRYMPARVPYLDWRGRRIGATFRCEVTPRMDLGAVRQALTEVPLIVMHEYVRAMHLGAMTGARIELADPAPPGREYYPAYFDFPVLIGCPRDALVIPAAWRAIPNLNFDETAWHAAIERCAAAEQPVDARDAVGRVRQALAAAVAKPGSRGVPTLDEVAGQLRCSPRTVIRRLRATGTTFQAEAEHVLKTRATALLTDRANRVQDVAARLGYADAASFRKAFRRWFGTAPADWRARD
ncbi:MAG: AraC family transcriptional regulator ligand-binding domain-containing protein [Gammaproteobacteria bacterium]